MRFSSLAIFASLLLAGCAVSPPPDTLSALDPANPALAIRATPYHPVVVDYTHREPVDPENWRRLNERLSPANRGGGS